MTIPKKAWDQITYLCSQISDIEWSAILFYKTEGEVTDIANFKVEAKELFLKDIGTVGFTSFNFGSDEVKRMMENEELMDYTIGKIHSHHNMSTFHSPTDWDDLWLNTETTNFYLSFITNNRFNLEVKIGWRAKQKVKTVSDYYIIDAAGKQIPQQLIEEKEDFIFIVADGIITVESDNTPDEWFVNRLAEVKATKAKQKAEKSKQDAEEAKKKSDVANSWSGKSPFSSSFTAQQQKKINTPSPSTATINFLAKFISMGSKSSVQEAIEAIEGLNGIDFALWEDNIMEGQLWNGMYERYFGKDFTNETQIAEQCLKILEKYKESNKDVAKVLISFLDDISSIDEEYFDDTKDLPTTLFNDAYAEHIEFFNSVTHGN